jgi:hypothetical protein
MAIYHFTVKVVSRGKGQSAVAKAAYNSRERLEDERTGETHDYRRKGGIAFSGIFAPWGAPEWAHDREELYNEIERREKRKDAQLLREVEVGLPHELTVEQRERLVKDFVREQFVHKGMLADVSIHEPDRDGDERNHHAHILLTMRELGPDGFGEKMREWNSREQVESWREAWERTANRYLEKHGHEARIDCRTLEEQGIDREPTTHRGPQADAMERDGIETDRGTQWRRTNERNSALAELKFELSALENEIRVAELEAYLDGVDRGQVAWDDAVHDAAIEKESTEGRFIEPQSRAHHERQDIGVTAQPSAPSEAYEAPERLAGRATNRLVGGIGKALDAAVTAIEGLFDYASRAAIRQRQEPEPTIDVRRYLTEDTYRQELMETEIAQRQQCEREYYQQQKERER